MKPQTITLDEAKRLHRGDRLHHVLNRNADGTAERWRVNGKVKTWKRAPGRVEVPIKYGMNGYGYITENNLDQFVLQRRHYVHTPK